MSKVCQICGKGPVAGRSIARRGKAKKHGGVGRRILRSSKRRFLPNLKRIKARVGRSVKTLLVCTRCIKSNKVTKA